MPIECPVCEKRFEPGEISGNNQTTCPNCQRSFDLALAVPIEAENTQRSSLTLTPEAQATFSKPGSLTAQDPDPIPEIQPEIVPNANPAMPSNLDHAKTRIRKQYDARKSRSNTNTLIVFLAAAGMMIALCAFFVIKLQERNDLEDTAGVDSLNTNSVIVKTDRDSNHSAFDGKEQNTKKRKNKTAKPVPEPRKKLSFFNRTEVNDCWERVHPYLVSLNIKSRFGNKRAVGTIVDSRGWIVTSYAAVKDAWEIEVIAAAQDLEEKNSSEQLTDLVRGVIATDPENNLALLAINRRFVESFAELAITEKNRVVRTQYLLQAAPPNEQNPYGQTEIQIKSRGRFPDLPKDIQNQVQRMELSSLKSTWLSTDESIVAQPGMPLLEADGTFVAMIVYKNGDASFAQPVHELKNLIGSASGDVKPFEIPTVKGESGEAVPVAVNSPGADLSIQLNLAGEACQPFDWLPTTQAQYAQLQEFSRALSTAFDFTNDPDHEMEEAKLVQQELANWEESLSMSLGRMIAREPKRLAAINEFAKHKIDDGDKTHAVFFGSVYIAGIESPNIIIKFDGDETFVSAPYSPESAPMRPGTDWLFFAETPALSRNLTFNVPGEGRIKANSATILYAIGPIER